MTNEKEDLQAAAAPRSDDDMKSVEREWPRVVDGQPCYAVN